MKRFFTALTFATALAVSGPAFAESSLEASDLKGHEFETELRTLANKGIMGGYEDKSIRPDNPVTRAEFAKLVVKSLNLRPTANAANSGNNYFTDVKSNHWFYTDVSIAVQAGIINGYPDQTFKPNSNISREEMAAMIHRALQQEELVTGSANVELSFKDAGNIQDIFIDDVQGVVAAKVMNGYGDGTFGPKTSTTRGQVAAVLTRVMNITNEPEPPAETEEPAEPTEDQNEPDESNQPPQEPEKPIETPVEPPKPTGFLVGTIDANGEPTNLKEYESYSLAKTNLKANDVMIKGDRIVYMKPGSGIAAANRFTEIYPTEALSGKSLTYVSGGTEFKYVDATEKAVKVEIAGTTGYVAAANIDLIPTEMSTGRSHYKVINGELYHSLYNPITNERAAILLGLAPVFMTPGTEYYSWDGVNFQTSTGTKTAYPYFLYMPLKTTTNYSAEDLDRYLQEKYPATKELPESPLVGTGEVYKEMEQKYGVNALYLMAHAIHESNWGRSKIAQDKKNIYGMQAYDSNPYGDAKVYESFAQSIEDAAIKVTKEYLAPNGKHYHGAVLGNKGGGMNVMYASDPFWGEKIAGHMYRADQYLGHKDIHQHSLAVQ